MRIAGIPFDLETGWPGSWEVTKDGVVGRAGAATDLFVDPFSGTSVATAPSLMFPVAGDFLLEAAVEVEFQSTFDAGVLLLWQDDNHWAKLCFELSPQGKPMVVSVVNRGVSDDCNSVSTGDGQMCLRVGRRGAGCVFHYSKDGDLWHFVRAFRLAGPPVQAGFLVQSPKGDGSQAAFGKIRYREETLADMRSGV